MSFPAGLPQAILETVLTRLALLFLSGAHGDLGAARFAASEMLQAYNVETPEQLCLAAEIISFSLHALEALGQAANPELSLNRILRLRGSAVSLSREAHKSQRKLDQLQRAGRAGSQPAPAADQPRPGGHQMEAAVRHPPPAAAHPPTAERPPAAGHPEINKSAEVLAEASRQPSSRQTTQAVGKATGKAFLQSFHKREMTRRITENLQRNQAKHLARTLPDDTTSLDPELVGLLPANPDPATARRGDGPAAPHQSTPAAA